MEQTIYNIELMKYLLTILFLFFISDIVAQKQWSLEDCVSYAIKHNIPLKRQDVLVAIKNLDNEMALRERLPSIGGYLNGYSTFGHAQDVFGNNQRNDNFNSNIGINTELIIYQYNYFKNQAEKATVQAEQERIEKDVLIRDLTLKVIQSYLETLLSQSLVNAQDSAINFSTQLLDKTEKRVIIGVTAPSVVSEVRANLAREKQQYQQYYKDLLLKKATLAQYMNYPEYNILKLYDPLLESNLLESKKEVYKENSINY